MEFKKYVDNFYYNFKINVSLDVCLSKKYFNQQCICIGSVLLGYTFQIIL